MSFTDIKNKSQSEKGFTIVELLIVVVVIAILAAITIVSYNGITSRANGSAAAAAAATAQKKAEAYNAEVSNYPGGLTDLTGATSDKSYYLTGVSATASLSTNPISTNGTKTILYVPCGVALSGTAAPTSQNGTAPTIGTPGPTGTGNFTGAIIKYYDYASGGTSVITTNIGQVSGTYAATGKSIGCPTV